MVFGCGDGGKTKVESSRGAGSVGGARSLEGASEVVVVMAVACSTDFANGGTTSRKIKRPLKKSRR